jgi:hypothetical protein
MPGPGSALDATRAVWEGPPVRRRPPWLILVFLAFGGLLLYGAFDTYQDRTSGTPGTAKVAGCTGGNGKYDRGIHCTGTWQVGGDLVGGDGRIAYGSIQGAGYRDVGKKIDVRIHGSDHATVPSLGTPIVFASLGGVVVLLSLWGLWSWARRPDPAGELALPPAIHAYLSDLVRQRWSGKDPEPALASLPRSLPPGRVQRLSGGGPFGWQIEGRLDEVDGRLALEALEDDRMSGPDHYRVWDDGTRESLPNEHIGYSLPKGYTPEDEERIKQEHFEHNHSVQQLLKERGFFNA